MSYQKHIFFCINQKEEGKKCCADANAEKFCDYAKSRLLAMELHGIGKIRVSRSGCLGRCKQGPAVVIYPDGVWYTYNNESDIDEIIEVHLVNGKIVTRLLMELPM